MDLESECSVLESVEDNEVNPESVSHGDDDKIKNNGSCSNEMIHELRSGQHLDGEGNSVENFQVENSPPLAVQSPAEGSPSVRKGFGLRKWRRIRRDVVKDAATSLDSGKVLKRGLSAPVNPAKPPQLSAEVRQNSEGSVGSINMAKHRGFVDGFAARASSSDSRFAAGPAFAAGTDSDNSEDRSSKSSTAASVPKAKYDLPAVTGHTRDKNKVKSLSNSAQRAQQGKSRNESSKKHRGEKIKIEKENSYSSMESDSRSTNFVFMQGTSNSNGKLSGTSLNYDGENSDEAHASEREEMQTGYSKENAEEVEDISPDNSAADLSWEAKEEKSENHQSSTDRDPLIDSILTLQSVQEALEKELAKFGEIGDEYALLGNNSCESSSVPADFGSGDPETLEPSSFYQTSYEKIGQSSTFLETQVLKLTQNVKLLECEVEQTRAMLQAKESRVAELEAALNSSNSPKEEYEEMETQIEDLFKQKVAAEIECMIIAMETRKNRVPAVDQTTLFKEQKALEGEQAKVLHKIGETESKAEVIKEQAEKLDKVCGDIIGTDEMLKMQRTVFRNTSCFVMQLILLIFVLWLFLSQFSPESGVVVPT